MLGHLTLIFLCQLVGELVVGPSVVWSVSAVWFVASEKFVYERPKPNWKSGSLE